MTFSSDALTLLRHLCKNAIYPKVINENFGIGEFHDQLKRVKMIVYDFLIIIRGINRNEFQNIHTYKDLVDIAMAFITNTLKSNPSLQYFVVRLDIHGKTPDA